MLLHGVAPTAVLTLLKTCAARATSAAAWTAFCCGRAACEAAPDRRDPVRLAPPPSCSLMMAATTKRPWRARPSAAVGRGSTRRLRRRHEPPGRRPGDGQGGLRDRRGRVPSSGSTRCPKSAPRSSSSARSSRLLDRAVDALEYEGCQLRGGARRRAVPAAPARRRHPAIDQAAERRHGRRRDLTPTWRRAPAALRHDLSGSTTARGLVFGWAGAWTRRACRARATGHEEERPSTALELSRGALLVYVGNLPPTELLDNEALGLPSGSALERVLSSLKTGAKQCPSSSAYYGRRLQPRQAFLKKFKASPGDNVSFTGIMMGNSSHHQNPDKDYTPVSAAGAFSSGKATPASCPAVQRHLPRRRIPLAQFGDAVRGRGRGRA